MAIRHDSRQTEHQIGARTSPYLVFSNSHDGSGSINLL
ncbi:DUF932 domain-containing protein [Paenibacillus baekrokdamisoli]